jgi:ABC-2 type transport system ATP-binding protein
MGEVGRRMPIPVTLEHVTKSYDSVRAVDDLSFEITSGQIFGLLGPNGAGKTSTLRMMIGITLPDMGQIRIFGEPLSRALLERVGYLPEERGLYRRMKVADNLTFLGQLRGRSTRDALALSRKWAERLQIADWLDRKVEELSKGMQQKIQFIATLLGDPEFIAMDEPFSGLDPIATNELQEILLQLKNEGHTILFSTHRMDQVERLCDAICLMHRGRAVLKGNLREIKARAGKRFVKIECDQSVLFLKEHPLVESFSGFGAHAEVGLKSASDAQELLRAVLGRARVTRFELTEPSLEQIFIDTVGKAA